MSYESARESLCEADREALEVGRLVLRALAKWHGVGLMNQYHDSLGIAHKTPRVAAFISQDGAACDWHRIWSGQESTPIEALKAVEG